MHRCYVRQSGPLNTLLLLLQYRSSQVRQATRQQLTPKCICTMHDIVSLQLQGDSAQAAQISSLLFCQKMFQRMLAAASTAAAHFSCICAFDRSWLYLDRGIRNFAADQHRMMAMARHNLISYLPLNGSCRPSNVKHTAQHTVCALTEGHPALSAAVRSCKCSNCCSWDRTTALH
jgi:hypothetical protein